MRLPVGAWIWLNAVVAPDLCAGNISTLIETRLNRSCPRQIGRVAAMVHSSFRPNAVDSTELCWHLFRAHCAGSLLHLLLEQNGADVHHPGAARGELRCNSM